MASNAETLSPALPDHIIDMALSVLDTAADVEVGLATAESCTGGLLASLLTDIEGKSGIFDRGFVSYSNQAKCDLLGLAHTMIDSCGAVSEQVARAMAEGALERSDAAIALAITGFAGPAGPDDEPGLVHFGCAVKGQKTRHREEHFGDIGRAATRIAAIEVALEMFAEGLSTLAANHGTTGESSTSDASHCESYAR